MPLFEAKSELSSPQGVVDVILVSVLLALEFCDLLVDRGAFDVASYKVQSEGDCSPDTSISYYNRLAQKMYIA